MESADLEPDHTSPGWYVAEQVGEGRIQGCGKGSIPSIQWYRWYGYANQGWRVRAPMYKRLGSEQAHCTK